MTAASSPFQRTLDSWRSRPGGAVVSSDLFIAHTHSARDVSGVGDEVDPKATISLKGFAQKPPRDALTAEV